MLLTLWAILNIVLFIYFIYLIFKAIGFVYKNKGLLPALVLVGGLLMILQQIDNSDSKKRYWQFIKNEDKDKIKNSSIYHLEIDKQGLTTFDLTVKTGEIENEINIPIEASSNVSGLMGGFIWKPKNISVKKESLEVHNYEVDGVLEWHLLGVKLYSQNRNFASEYRIRKTDI